MRDSIKEKLNEDGYVVIEDFLRPAECEELLQAGKDLCIDIPEECIKSVFAADKDESPQHKDQYFCESNDKIRYFLEQHALGEDGKLKVDKTIAINKVGHALHLLHPLFRCYTYSDRVKAICQELNLKDPAVVQSMYIYKNAGIGGVVAPHQDSTYLHTEPDAPVGFWIALEDATVQNGCLWIARGSHKSGVHRRLFRKTDEKTKQIVLDYDRPSPTYHESSFTPIPVTKGTCILLHGLVVHKSAANRSAQSRHAYTFHVVEKKNNNYSPENWLQEGSGAPFHSLYTTEQIV